MRTRQSNRFVPIKSSRSRSRSPKAQNYYYFGNDKLTKWFEDIPPSNVRIHQLNAVFNVPAVNRVT